LWLLSPNWFALLSLLLSELGQMLLLRDISLGTHAAHILLDGRLHNCRVVTFKHIVPLSYITCCSGVFSEIHISSHSLVYKMVVVFLCVNCFFL
jgi:hypothetical protein